MYTEKTQSAPNATVEPEQLLQAYARNDLNGAEALWKALHRTLGLANQLALPLIRKRMAAQDYSGALHAAQQAAKYWPQEPKIQQRHRELNFLYGSSVMRPFEPVTEQMLQAPDASAEELFLELKICSYHVSNTEIIALLKAFVQRWPDHVAAIRLLLSKLLLEGACQDIVSLCQQRYTKQQKHESFFLKLWIQAMVELHRLDEALQLAGEESAQLALNKEIVEFLLVNSIGQGIATNTALQSTLDSLCQRYKVEGLDQAIAFEKALREPLRPLISAFRPTQAVVSSSQAAADCLVIIFSGGARRLPVPQTLLDHFFASHGMAVVRLVDKEGCYYLNGIPELGDSFETSVQKLREIAQSYGVRRIITLGNSAGGIGALHYGVALNASHILAYSPLTNLRLDFFNHHGDYRNRPQICKINDEVSAERLDIKAILDKGCFNGKVELYAGEYCIKDLVHLDHLDELPNVSTHTVKGIASHTAVTPALLDGTLLQALQCLK